MNEVVDMRQHRAQTQGDSAMRVVLLAMRWTRARDDRLAAAKAKKAAEDSGLLYILRSDVDAALTTARREEARAKRLLLVECKTLMQRQQADLIDV